MDASVGAETPNKGHIPNLEVSFSRQSLWITLEFLIREVMG